jgi:DNA-binding response OmpR family regulator
VNVGRRVLVVDDDDVGRSTLAEILRLEGFTVEEAEGGRAALRHLEGGNPEVMLLDLKMPDMSGLAVLEAAGRLSPETQVIVFTAHGSMESAIQAVRHGAYDYLLKPTSPQDILACVRRAASRHDQMDREKRLLVHLGDALHEMRESEGEAEHPVLAIGRLQLELDQRRLEGERGTVELTPAETRLLLALFGRRGQVVGYAELVGRVQGYQVEDWEAPAMLRPVVSRLRGKLQRAGGRAEWIGTIRGAGYMMAQDPE